MMRLHAGDGGGAGLRRGVAADLEVGRRRLGGGAVRGQQHRDRGDAGERGDGRLGGGAGRLELRALGGVDLEQEAHAVALHRERADHVGVDEAAAGAGHRHRGERGEDGFTGHGHRRFQMAAARAREARKG